METVGYSNALNAYEVRDPDLPQGNELKDIKKLPDHKVYHAYQFDNMLFIVKKEHCF